MFTESIRQLPHILGYITNIPLQKKEKKKNTCLHSYKLLIFFRQQ